MNISRYIENEMGMEKIGAILSRHIHPGAVIFLQGPLGAGKTTVVRGFLRSLGYTGIVRSPTYTFVESYHLPNKVIHHFDFYRIKNCSEADYLGLNDYFTNDAICLIEWPENVLSLLPKATVCCTISTLEKQAGRQIHLQTEGDTWIGNESLF